MVVAFYLVDWCVFCWCLFGVTVRFVGWVLDGCFWVAFGCVFCLCFGATCGGLCWLVNSVGYNYFFTLFGGVLCYCGLWLVLFYVWLSSVGVIMLWLCCGVVSCDLLIWVWLLR